MSQFHVPRTDVRRSAVLCSVLAALLAAPRAESAGTRDDGGALVIREENIEWGFDGKAGRNTFTLLSVLIENNDAGPFDGTLRLTRSIGLGQQIDAVMERKIYLSGAASQWVQFVPFVIDDRYQWTLSWGAGRSQRAELPSPRVGEPSAVLLFDPQNLSQPSVPIKRFREELFPTSVTATDMLTSLAMDHAPFWQPPQEQAFLEWFQRGGRVTLFHGPDGSFPRFTGDLAFMNAPEDRFRLGRGMVQRMPIAVRDISEDDAARLTLRRDDSVPPQIDYATSFTLSSDARTSYTQTGMRPDMLLSNVWQANHAIFYELEAAARFARHWWLIYLAALAYLAAMFPGCYHLGRTHPQMFRFYAAYVGSAALFGTIFFWLGRVGGGDHNRVRTVAVAREIADGRFDVTQWSSIAAISGDVYDVRHNGTGRLYSTCQEVEAVHGTITAGPDAAFSVDIPPASTRTLLHRTRLDRPPLELRVVQFDALGDRLLSFAYEGGPDSDEMLGAFCAYGSRIYSVDLAASGGRLKLERGSLSDFLVGYGDPFRESSLHKWEDDINRSDQERYRVLARWLVGCSFSLADTVDPDRLVVPPGHVRLFLYTELSDEFRLQGSAFPDQTGYVLFVVDLPTGGA